MVNTKEITYIAVLHKDDNSCWGVTVPDLKGCFGAGEDPSDAIASAREAASYHLETLVSERSKIPTASDINFLMDCGEFEGGLWALLKVDVSGIAGLS